MVESRAITSNPRRVWRGVIDLACRSVVWHNRSLEEREEQGNNQKNIESALDRGLGGDAVFREVCSQPPTLELVFSPKTKIC